MATDLQLQTNNRTFMGRHWTEHNVLRRYISSDDKISILSFGCSTGEELASLRLLFPGARLFGCDIDWGNLQTARALLGNEARVFASTDRTITEHGPYDVIVCNSVLLQPTVTNGDQKHGIDPDVWRRVLAILDSALNPGGILQIINPNIPFRYHPLYAGYEPLRTPLIIGPNFVDLFDPSGRHLCTGVAGAGWSGILNRHLGEEGWSELQPTDFSDVHFRKRGSLDALPAVVDEVIPSMPISQRWATGTMAYRPELWPDPRPSSHTEIDVVWTALGVDSVRLDRTTRRIWFDGAVVAECKTVVDLVGAEAGAFLENATGRRSSRLAMDRLITPRATRSFSI